MRFLIDFIKGILIGCGAILPGISSGVFCVIFGIYEKLINSVLNLFHDFKKNFIFLLPIGLGGITSVLLVGKLLNFLFNAYPMPTKFCFIGLILGSIPILFRQANHKNGFRLHYLAFLGIAFLVGFLSIKLEAILPEVINLDLGENNFFYFVLSGLLMSIGIVVPGVSSSVILMCLRCLSSLFKCYFYCKFVYTTSYGNWSFSWLFIIFKNNSSSVKTLLYTNILCYYWICIRFCSYSISRFQF